LLYTSGALLALSPGTAGLDESAKKGGRWSLLSAGSVKVLSHSEASEFMTVYRVIAY
jgi:hypothetical protein